MNIRREWLDTIDFSTNSISSQYYSAEETISDVKENFDIRRYYSAEGADVTVDGIDCRALVQYFSNPLNKVKYDRELHVPMDINIHTGSLVDYKGTKWLVTSSIDDLQAYKSSGIVETNNTLNFYHNNIPYSIPCIIGNQISLSTSLSTDENRYIETLSNEIFVRIPANSETAYININDKFKIGKFSYQVLSISDIVENGLYVLKMSFIADEVVLPVYTISILNNTPLQIAQFQPLTLNVGVYKDGILLTSPPPYSFSSLNELIATVDENGVVSILSLGTVSFSVVLDNDSSITDSIEVEIVADVVDNFTVGLVNPPISIIKGNSTTYTCEFKNNGTVITDNSVFYLTADDGISETTFAQIVSQDSIGNSCVVKGLGFGYVKLWVKNNEGSIVSSGFRIQIKSIF